MAKTISDAKLARARSIIDSTVEPRISAMVEQLNVVLSKVGIRAGAEIQWFFDEIEPTDQSSEEVQDD